MSTAQFTDLTAAASPDRLAQSKPSFTERVRANPWVRSVRPHQWSKAALVLAAPFAAFHISVLMALQLSAAVALACMAASGTYLLNDVIDAPVDRLHPTKCLRPIAAGAIGRIEALIVAALLLSLAPIIGRFLNGPTGLALAAYVVLTVAYSTKLKSIPILDILTIAAGFVVRVLIGAAATRTAVSVWFLLAVAAAAIMVAAGKRRGEVFELGEAAAAHRRSLSVYGDPVTTRILAFSAGLLFLSVLAWVIVGGGGPHLEESWAAVLLLPVIVGIGRYVFVALRGNASRPEQLVGDRVLQITGVVTVLIFVLGSVYS